ncbi:hypothetical protein EOL94_04665 [bacterium]|nr:hypothetical protein [bacterium]
MKYIILKRTIDNKQYYYPVLIIEFKHSNGNRLFIGKWNDDFEGIIDTIPCDTIKEAKKRVPELKKLMKNTRKTIEEILHITPAPPFTYTMLEREGFSFI